MKKALSIFLLAVALFNLGGYGLFMACLEKRADEKMAAQLDANRFDQSRLISIKAPVVNLPYYTNSAQWNRVDGSITIAGVVYNYVKLRIYNDSLELLCIPNADAARLLACKVDYVKLINGLQGSGQGKKNGAGGKGFKYFSPENYAAKNAAANGIYAVSAAEKFNRTFLILPFYFVRVIDDPPDAS